MVKAWIGSMLGAALVGGGWLAARAQGSGEEPAAKPASSCCSTASCDAKVECDGDGCTIRWTAPDGRTGEIELACKDGACEVVRCTPCDADGGAPPSCGPVDCGTPCGR